MPLKPTAPHHVRNVANRVRLTRAALELSQAEICRQTGITTSAWNNSETGDNRLSVNDTYKLRQVFKITSDWIYFGDKSGLPYALVKKIDAASK